MFNLEATMVMSGLCMSVLGYFLEEVGHAHMHTIWTIGYSAHMEPIGLNEAE